MSERELNRIEVLSQVTRGAMTVVTAANVLRLSRRQVHRLQKEFQTDGPAATRHKARGRASNNRIDPAVRAFAVTLVRENYIDFGPTFAAEKLEEDHGLKVSRETLRKWMQDAELWLSRKQRRTFHQPRLRRERYGKLIQIDGSDHRWFEDRGPPCTLNRSRFIGDLYHCAVLPSALMARSPIEHALDYDPVTLKMRSCLGWNRAEMASTVDRLTLAAQGAGGDYFWVFPPA